MKSRAGKNLDPSQGPKIQTPNHTQHRKASLCPKVVERCRQPKLEVLTRADMSWHFLFIIYAVFGSQK
jgi:hypothetical protein